MDVEKIIALKTLVFEVKELLNVEYQNLSESLNQTYQTNKHNVRVYSEKCNATNDFHSMARDFLAQIDRYQSRIKIKPYP